MLSLNFSASNGNAFVNGILVLNNQNPSQNHIAIESNQSNFSNISIKEKSVIKNPQNFLAALFNKYDKEELFDFITVNDEVVNIIRNTKKEKTMSVQVIDNFPNKIIFKPQTLKVIDIDDKIAEISSSDFSNTVEVPIDFNYTKNKLLNSILKFNAIPADYDRSWNNKILNFISKQKNLIFADKKNNFIFLDKYMKRQSKYNKFTKIIIPRNLIIN